MLAVIGLYIYEVVFLKKPFTENLAKFAAILCGLVGTLVKIFTKFTAPRRPLSFYEKTYEKEIENAFKDNAKAKKELLQALRFFNENEYKKAIKIFQTLIPKIKNQYDAFAVLTFMGRSYSDIGFNNDTIEIYNKLLQYTPYNSTVHNNLGMAYSAEGDFETAMAHYDDALKFDPDYYFAHMNKANCYFYQYKLDETIECAKKALELKNNDTNSSGLLAIVYALKGDKEISEKYFHIAVNNGKNPKEMNEAIQYYLAKKEEFEQEKASLN